MKISFNGLPFSAPVEPNQAELEAAILLRQRNTIRDIGELAASGALADQVVWRDTVGAPEGRVSNIQGDTIGLLLTEREGGCRATTAEAHANESSARAAMLFHEIFTNGVDLRELTWGFSVPCSEHEIIQDTGFALAGAGEVGKHAVLLTAFRRNWLLEPEINLARPFLAYTSNEFNALVSGAKVGDFDDLYQEPKYSGSALPMPRSDAVRVAATPVPNIRLKFGDFYRTTQSPSVVYYELYKGVCERWVQATHTGEQITIDPPAEYMERFLARNNGANIAAA